MPMNPVRANVPLLQKACSWLVILSVLIGLALLVLPHPWLYRRVTPVPFLILALSGILLFSMLLSSRVATLFWSIYLRLSRWLKSRYERSPRLFLVFAFVLLTIAFWYFRIQRTDSGDIIHFEYAALQGRVFTVEHAPLETLLRCWASVIHTLSPAIGLIPVFKLLTCIYGGLYVLFIAALSSRLPLPYCFLAPLLFIVTPALSLFCGYQEVYGFPLLAEAVFLLAGLLYLHGRFSLTVVSLLFGISAAAGFWNGINGLGYLYLLWTARKRGELRWIGLWEQSLYTFAPLLISLALLSFYTNPFAGFITRLSEPSLLIPLNIEAQVKNYGLFSPRHLADWANELILLALVPVVIFIARVFCHFSSLRRLWRRSEFRFAALCAGPSLLFGFMYYPVIGFPLDWDLYTFIFPSASLLGVVLMNDIHASRVWRKRFVALVLLSAVIAAVWILQNALFWRYPVVASTLGPALSPLIPNYYFSRMKQAFDQEFESHLYWLGEQAMLETPGKYREILQFMDDWTLSTIAKIPPKAFDYSGWARDFALMSGTEQLYIFDRYGRIFLSTPQGLKWVFAPETFLNDDVMAGDFLPDGAAIMLTRQGKVLRAPKALLDAGAQGQVNWAAVETLHTFLPKPPSEKEVTVHMVDLAMPAGTGKICVVDNFNRVWDVESKTLLLQGEPSFNLVQSLHFTQNHQPITIDVNDRVSYNREQVRFPFENRWFYPIVRDFQLTQDEKGIMVMDINGNIHYTGATAVYEDVVSPGDIVDRYIRLMYKPAQDEIWLLDNRYRLVKAGIDTGGITTRQKVQTMLDSGNYISAYNTLSTLWRKGGHFTPICYEILDIELLRKIQGLVLWRPEDIIPIYVDALVLRDDLIVLLDRWGRLVYENKGSLFLLEGSGLQQWPRAEAIDGALASDRVLFLCQDGSVWEYHFPDIFGQADPQFDHTPKLWTQLNDYAEGQQWMSIEATPKDGKVLALSSSGTRLELGLDGKPIAEAQTLPTGGKALFDAALRDTEAGYQLAYTSQEGPAFLYSSADSSTREFSASNFGWPVVADITFSKGENIILSDRYGVLHQFNPACNFSAKPYSVIMDVIALRFLKDSPKALWIRSNGEIQGLRVK